MNRKLAVIVFIFYLTTGLATLSQYGISWDEPTHYRRGQAYLYYFLTGNRNYDELPAYDINRAQTEPEYHRRSLYQDDSEDGEYFLENDSGHPPLNGILASISNYIFYQQLGIMDDVHSYHLFILTTVALSVAIVFLWGTDTYGKAFGLAAALFYGFYPLLWAESHFNIKDPVETAFITITIYFIWKAYNTAKAKFVIMAALSCGAALATKFNVLFIPIIISPWLVVEFIFNRKKLLKVITKKHLLLSMAVFPIITIAILVTSWPFLWSDPFVRFLEILDYYRSIGTETSFHEKYLLFGWNTYPVRWIFYTTPLIMIFTAVVGAIGLLFKKRFVEHRSVSVLWLSLFLVPLLRSSIPGVSIYGGVRQIMEYVPGLAFIAAIGYISLHRFLTIKSRIFSLTLLPIVVILYLIPLFKFHPYENTYISFLGGGLNNAVASGLPAAGNTFGSAYKHGVEWLNKNAEKNARVSLIQGYPEQNIPEYWWREDIYPSNNNWSGVAMEGEYVMELNYNYETRTNNYMWEYLEKFMLPVYEVKVDGEPILKMWRNMEVYAKEGFRFVESDYNGQYSLETGKDYLTVSFPDELVLSRVNLSCNINIGDIAGGAVYSRLADGTWLREKDNLGDNLITSRNEQSESMDYYWAARKASAVKFVLSSGSCLLQQPTVSLKVFADE